MLELDNSLRRQSYNLPTLLEEQFEDLKQQISTLFEVDEIQQIDHVILTGCGDSYAAGLTLKNALEDLMHIPVELVTAIEFSRFYKPWKLTNRTLVVAISISGNGARLKEILSKANHYGAKTLGITKQRDSDVGRGADQMIELHISPFERGPGNRNYFVSVLALLILGINIGEQRGEHTPKMSDSYYKEILNQGIQLEEHLPVMDEILEGIAREWYKYVAFDFVGAGMDYGSAWFGHAKIIEATGAFATHINAEEWFHMNNFFKDRLNCGTIFVASQTNNGLSRVKEAIGYSERIGRPTIVITDSEEVDKNINVTYIKVPTSTFEPAMALTQYVPICILAGYMGALLNERNCRGCLGAWEFAAGGKYINNSELVLFGGEA